MANGEMLEELRQILGAEAPISQKVTTRLTLAALAEVLTKVEEIKCIQREIEKNYAIRAGAFIERHPKRTILGVILIMAATNAWFVSGFRKPLITAILKALGLPDDLTSLIP